MNDEQPIDDVGRTAPPPAHGPAYAHAVQTPHPAYRRQHQPYVVAIGGGKGGVGKSLISANLSLTLAQAGLRVTLFDADLGGANAHTCLGLAAPKVSVADFVGRKVLQLAEVVVETGYTNLSLISGALDWMQAANPKPNEKARLGDALLQLATDVLVVDLGAGTSLHTIDFFLMAQQGIVTLVPEPTAIENAYRFMKMACIRRLQALEASFYARPVLGRALEDPALRGLKSPAELLREVQARDPGLGGRLANELAAHPFDLVVNQVRTPQEAELAESIKQACRRYFGVSIDNTVSIPFDDTAWQAVRRRRPVVDDFPDGVIATGIQQLAGLIQQREREERQRHQKRSLARDLA